MIPIIRGNRAVWITQDEWDVEWRAALSVERGTEQGHGKMKEAKTGSEAHNNKVLLRLVVADSSSSSVPN